MCTDNKRQQYADWITANVPDYCYGKCAEITLAMAAAFPELKRVRGHVYTDQYTFPHWWLVSDDGIVDPTASQFDLYALSEPPRYAEHDESGPTPTGKCPNCGGYSYDNQTLCSIKCISEYVTFCNERI